MKFCLLNERQCLHICISQSGLGVDGSIICICVFLNSFCFYFLSDVLLHFFLLSWNSRFSLLSIYGRKGGKKGMGELSSKTKNKEGKQGKRKS